MKPKPTVEARRWLEQARSDLAFAELGVRERYPALADLQEATRRLDQYDVPTRYPNDLPGGVPAEMFSRAQATEAVALARQIVRRAEALIGD